MTKRVKIPMVDSDERIGSVFNDLFGIINQTEQDDSEDIEWDFQNASFLHPFFLAPLTIYKQWCEKNVACTNLPEHIKKYFNLIHFDNLYSIEDNMDLRQALSTYVKRSYTPICQFRLSNKNIDSIQSILQNIIKVQSNYSDDINMPLSYLLSELICNIGQHSHSEYGYLFSQYLNHEECIDLCIADTGITIYGSYIQTNKYLNLINGNEAMALKLANNGFSTKDLRERGFGLSTSRKMLVEGMGGAFFMLSGGAFHRHDKNGDNCIQLPKPIRWPGTIILMRIPTTPSSKIDFYKYIEQ